MLLLLFFLKRQFVTKHIWQDNSLCKYYLPLQGQLLLQKRVPLLGQFVKAKLGQLLKQAFLCFLLICSGEPFECNMVDTDKSYICKVFQVGQAIQQHSMHYQIIHFILLSAFCNDEVQRINFSPDLLRHKGKELPVNILLSTERYTIALVVFIFLTTYRFPVI